MKPLQNSTCASVNLSLIEICCYILRYTVKGAIRKTNTNILLKDTKVSYSTLTDGLAIEFQSER